MENIFIVIGTTGEYSDRSEWPARAFLDKEKAQKFAEECQNIAADLFAQNRDGCRWGGDVKHPLDSRCSCDYTGTTYYVEETELQRV